MVLKLVGNINIIQFQSLEAFSFFIITLSYICFLLTKLKIFRITEES